MPVDPPDNLGSSLNSPVHRGLKKFGIVIYARRFKAHIQADASVATASLLCGAVERTALGIHYAMACISGRNFRHFVWRCKMSNILAVSIGEYDFERSVRKVDGYLGNTWYRPTIPATK